MRLRHLIKMINGDEYDCLTKGGRAVHAFRAGERARVKRAYRRRERRKCQSDRHSASQA